MGKVEEMWARSEKLPEPWPQLLELNPEAFITSVMERWVFYRGWGRFLNKLYTTRMLMSQK